MKELFGLNSNNLERTLLDQQSSTHDAIVRIFRQLDLTIGNSLRCESGILPVQIYSLDGPQFTLTFRLSFFLSHAAPVDRHLSSPLP